MKILIISDTHGRRGALDEVLERTARNDAVIFLGDGIRDLGYRQIDGLVAVRGNCDVFSLSSGGIYAPEERTVCFDGVRILMLHGHTAGVKGGIERACARAVAAEADVLLYGHTHVARQEYFPSGSVFGSEISKKELHAFNPGSIGQPSDGKPSFGVMEIRNGQILLSHGKL